MTLPLPLPSPRAGGQRLRKNPSLAGTEGWGGPEWDPWEQKCSKAADCHRRALPGWRRWPMRHRGAERDDRDAGCGMRDPARTRPAPAEDGGDQLPEPPQLFSHLTPAQRGWSSTHHLPPCFTLPCLRLQLEHPGRWEKGAGTGAAPGAARPQLQPSHCEYLKPTGARVSARDWARGWRLAPSRSPSSCRRSAGAVLELASARPCAVTVLFFNIADESL